MFENDRLSIDRVVTDARSQYESLHSTSIREPDEQERHYREKIEGSKTLQRLKQAMDEWCSIWFWPTNETQLSQVPTPLSFHADDENRAEIVRSLQAAMKFFHWELEFPDVFSGTRWGFDAVVGNPPWENSQPSPYEFFCDYEPLVRTFSRVELLKRMDELFSEVGGLEDDWFTHCGFFKAFSNWISFASDPFAHADDAPNPLGRGDEHLVERWKEHRRSRISEHATTRPFQLQIGRVFTYKLFLEQSYRLLDSKGRLGMIVPSGLYTDSWSLPLRELFLEKSSWEWLFSFENKKKVFDIHGSFKFAVVIVDRIKRSKNDVLKAAFMVHDLSEWEKVPPPVIEFDRSQVPLFAPKSKSLPEIRSQRALDVCKAIYESSSRIGEPWNGSQVAFNLEFMMNTDAKKFPVRARWEDKGFAPDSFGRWKDGDSIALPLYEGRMIGQFDVLQKGWISGRGRSAVWREMGFDFKRFEPQFLMAEETFLGKESIPHTFKIGFMDVTSATNTRTFIACPIARMPCGNKVPTLQLRNLRTTLLMSAFLNSLGFDFVCRNRFGGTSLNWFIVEELPVPHLTAAAVETLDRIAISVARLAFLHRWFAPEWMVIKESCEFEDREWKKLWAVTEGDRLRLRIEIDCFASMFYGITPDDFDWIVTEDRNDPKGFWRVDKTLPYEERLTGLSARAFRALKDGKWSAETVGQLSNDEFFDLLGIPELTSTTAAQAKGLSGPLILKRDGCHSWQPEHFPADDPRHGWTWEDCRKDAITLLGSEEALKEYIAKSVNGQQGAVDGGEEEPMFALTNDPPKPKQGRLF